MPDRERVIAWLADEELYYREHGDMHNSLMASDALAMLKDHEIVRCRDCKYWRKLLLNRDGDGACHADNPVRVSSQDWYCADGERRTDDA